MALFAITSRGFELVESAAQTRRRLRADLDEPHGVTDAWPFEECLGFDAERPFKEKVDLERNRAVTRFVRSIDTPTPGGVYRPQRCL
jgi:hypothetical protein